MFNASKKSFGKFLCAVLSLVLLVSTVIMPVGAVQICTKGHTDANSDYICDVCGIFTGKVTGLSIVYEKSGSVKIKWNEVPGADGYFIYFGNISDDSEDDFKFDGNYGGIFNTPVGETSSTSFVLSLAISPIVIDLVVRAYKNVGNEQILSEKSAPLEIHTTPDKVTGLKKSDVMATSVVLSWDGNALLTLLGGKYNIYQYDSANKAWKKIKTTKNIEYKVKNLKKKTTYKFRVEAYYKDGKKAYIGDVSRTLTVKTGDTQLNLKSTKLAVGTKQTLFVDGTSKKVTWSTSNKKVATVSSKGVIKGVKAGKATITAKVGKKSYTCKVEVKTPSAYLDWYFRKYNAIEIENSNGTEYSSIALNRGKYEFGYFNGTASCQMSFKKGSKNAKAELSYLDGDYDMLDIKTFDASSTFAIAKYSNKNQLIFKISNREGISKKNARKMSNDVLSDSFAAWNKLLKKKTGLTMKDFGFTAYKTK